LLNRLWPSAVAAVEAEAAAVEAEEVVVAEAGAAAEA
jgi:hypothetical protein